MFKISTLMSAIRFQLSKVIYNKFNPSDRLIGIMMIRNENDILKETIRNITQIYDRIFVLDGTEPDDEFERGKSIMEGFDEIKLIIRDTETPGPFPIRDGARQYLLEKVREKFGEHNWIGVIHGDELYIQDPRLLLPQINPFINPVVQVRLCHFFLHTDDEEKWDKLKNQPVEEAITHYMWPGTPEDRIFYDNGKVNYDPSRHSLVVPYDFGIGRVLLDDFIIKQYNYRNPQQMASRAQQRIASQWQKNHYEHIEYKELYFVNSLHVPGYKPCGYDNVREPDETKWSQPRSTREYPLPCLRNFIAT